MVTGTARQPTAHQLVVARRRLHRRRAPQTAPQRVKETPSPGRRRVNRCRCRRGYCHCRLQIADLTIDDYGSTIDDYGLTMTPMVAEKTDGPLAVPCGPVRTVDETLARRATGRSCHDRAPGTRNRRLDAQRDWADRRWHRAVEAVARGVGAPENMETSDVRRRIKDSLERARKLAADRRARNTDDQRGLWGVPAERGCAGVPAGGRRAQGRRLPVHREHAGRQRAAGFGPFQPRLHRPAPGHDRRAPASAGPRRTAEGVARQRSDERPLKPDSTVSDLTEQDVLDAIADGDRRCLVERVVRPAVP